MQALKVVPAADLVQITLLVAILFVSCLTGWGHWVLLTWDRWLSCPGASCSALLVVRLFHVTQPNLSCVPLTKPVQRLPKIKQFCRNLLLNCPTLHVRQHQGFTPHLTSLLQHLHIDSLLCRQKQLARNSVWMAVA